MGTCGIIAVTYVDLNLNRSRPIMLPLRLCLEFVLIHHCYTAVLRINDRIMTILFFTWYRPGYPAFINAINV